MNIVHIAYKYGLKNTGGAAIAATRLHLALLNEGVNSHYICIKSAEGGTNVHVLPARGSMCRGVYCLAAKLLRGFWRFTHYRKTIFLNIVPLFGLEELLDELKPDVVHVHWIISDVMSYEQLGKIRYPVVMHLHDLFPVNIIAPWPANDRRFVEGITWSNSNFLERWLFNRKRKAISRLHPVFIGPSRWICSLADASIIGKGSKFYFVHNVIDNKFTFDPQARVRHDKFRILFGAYGGRLNPKKGWIDFEMALEKLPFEIKRFIEIQVFGEEFNDFVCNDIKVLSLGKITSPESLAKIYHESDVFVLPSKEDNAPSTKFEALLCGLPVLAFSRTGCAEAIAHKVNGWVSPDGDIPDFAAGITYFYGEWKLDAIEHAKIAEAAQKEFNTCGIVASVIDVYKKVAYA